MAVSFTRTVCAKLSLVACIYILAACASRPIPTQPPQQTPPPPKVVAGKPALHLLGPLDTALPGWGTEDGRDFAAALLKSCKSLTKQNDISELTQPADWAGLCTAVGQDSTDSQIKALLAAELQAVQVGDGIALNTGYYEPELLGSLTKTDEFSVPLYRRPPELVDADLGAFRSALKNQKIAGSVHNSRLTPYFDRAAITAGALAGRNLEIAWVRSEWDSFFLQVQGSGRVRLPDGTVLRLSYGGQNGHEYTSIGKLMLSRNLLAKGQATMQGMRAWGELNKEEGLKLLNENRSFVFFKPNTISENAVGALGIALTPNRSLAVDPLYVPLGAPVWLDSRRTAYQNTPQAPFIGLRIAQDTGGAIKGPNRVDIFFGTGDEAAILAGSQSFRGRLTLLLPRASVVRLQANGRLNNIAF